MANAITSTIFASPGDIVSNLPASFTGGIATNIIRSVKPYTGSISGVSSIINVGFTDGRSLRVKGRYLVHETVAAIITAMG